MHLAHRLQVPVGRPAPAKAHVVDGAAFPDTGDDILQDPAVGMVEQNVVGHHRPHRRGPRGFAELMQSHLVARPPMQGQGQMGVVAEDFDQMHQVPTRRRQAVGDQHGDPSFAPSLQVVPPEPASALARPPLAHRQQATEPGVARPVPGIDENLRPILQHETAAHDQPNPGRPRCLVRPDDARQTVPVRHRQRVEPTGGRLGKQLLARTRPSQEREVGRALEFDVRHGPNGRFVPVMFTFFDARKARSLSYSGGGGV